MKTRIIIISAVIIFIVAVILGVYLIKKRTDTTDTVVTTQVEQSNGIADFKVEVSPIEIPNVEGKLRSMNGTQIFIELSDGNGSAINVEPSVSVKKEGEEKKENLSILKVGDSVSVKVDENQNAKEILIKK